jgi:hypothetical protein
MKKKQKLLQRKRAKRFGNKWSLTKIHPASQKWPWGNFD